MGPPYSVPSMPNFVASTPIFTPQVTPNPTVGFPLSVNGLLGVPDPVQRQFDELRALISKIPGMPQPLDMEGAGSFADTPFADSIASIEIPKKVTVPNLKLYDGRTDPVEHITQYKQRMMIIPIPQNIKEACMCKGFGSTMSGPALEWFVRGISSFAELVNLFNVQFASSRKFEKDSSDLYRVMQRYDEPLRDYLTRFNDEKLSIKDCNVPTAVEAFRKGLLLGSELYKDLTKYRCKTFEDVKAKAKAAIRLEEDALLMAPESDRPERKAPSARRDNRDNRGKPYQRPKEEARNVYSPGDWKNNPDLPPRVSEYGFNTNPAGVVRFMEKLGDAVRWPRPSTKPNAKRDKSKFCDYHNDNGHITNECVALRKEIAHQWRKGS